MEALGARRGDRIGAIESLRGLAALCILSFHAAFVSGLIASDSPVRLFASRLDVGLPIFFLISGFLLYRPFVRARVLGTRPPWIARYATSRVLRIVPAYWVALAVITVWLGLSGVFTAKGIPIYFGFLQVYDPAYRLGGLPLAWTLCVEVVFYAFLPLYALLIRRLPGGSRRMRLRNEWLGVTAMFAVGTALNLIVLLALDPSPGLASYLFSFPAFMDQFALGMGVAVLATQAEGRSLRALLFLDRFPITPLLISAGAFVLVVAAGLGVYSDAPTPDLRWEARHLLFGLVALGLILSAVFAKPEHGWIHAAMTTRPGRWLGDVSYGIYLWHGLFLRQIHQWGFNPPGPVALRWLEWIVLAALPTIAFAAASWYGLERPALSLRNRVAQWLADQVARVRHRPAPVTEPEAETDIAAP
jgi:peptidoglycan/LPS O-acetylase OafA/YrhL